MFKEAIEKYYPEMVEIRKDFHRHPEMSWKEFRTCEKVMGYLKEYGAENVRCVWNTGVLAEISGNGEGKCIAIRADIDALPVNEETGVDFASENPGVMHACGHDLHTTILLTVARVLCENRDKFKGTVRLIFQPAEESGCPADPTGGAKHMCEYGAMEGVDAIIALHVTPSHEKAGSFGLKKGVITSGFDLYRVDVKGTAAHGSMPQKGNDAILAISQFIVLLQQIVSRNIDPLKSVILTIGTLSGGTVVNIIPGEATCGGCFRYYDNSPADVNKTKVDDNARGIESVSGCKFTVEAKRGYACVDNDESLVNLAVDTLSSEMGKDAVLILDEPASGSEDFSYYGLSTGKPQMLMWLNAEPFTDEIFALHSNKCIMKHEIIKTGAEGLASIAVNYLNS